MIIFGRLHFSCGEKLNCEFVFLEKVYSCEVTSLENNNNNMTIDGYNGVHNANKSDTDIQVIYIHDTNVKYIPENLGILLNLTLLNIESTDLVEIKANDFKEMQDILFLSLIKNNLTSLPSDVFGMLKLVYFIDLRGNKIEEIPNQLFSNNPNLDSIYFNNNLIKFIGSELFNGLVKLEIVDFYKNVCLSEWYKGPTELIQMKKDIELNCTNPNEIPATTTTTLTTSTTTTTTPTPINRFINILSSLIKINDKLRGITS